MSDGTPGGTFELADLCPGACSSLPRFIAADGRRLYFSAYVGSSEGERIFVSDGTKGRTAALTASWVSYQPQLLPLGGSAVSGSLVYFLAADAEHGTEIWRTDGTMRGTFRISEIGPLFSGAEVTDFVALDGKLIFVTDDGRGPALWLADGSETGTRLLLDPDPGSDTNLAPADLVQAGRHVYFTVSSPRLGRELWRTDGTPQGTVNVVDLVRGERGLTRFSGRSLGGRLLFVAEGPGLPQQLWISGGTTATTFAVTRFRRAHSFVVPPPLPAQYLPALEFKGRMLVPVDDGVHGFEPWLTDGTLAGTHLLLDVCPGPCEGWVGFVGDNLDRGFFFRGDDGLRGREIWFSDGSAAGTHLTRDLCPGVCNGTDAVGRGFRVGSNLLFILIRPDESLVLARTDGSTRGTSRLGVIGVAGVLPPSLRIASTGGEAVFPGSDPEHGAELWHSDGTVAGTGLLLDLETQ